MKAEVQLTLSRSPLGQDIAEIFNVATSLAKSDRNVSITLVRDFPGVTVVFSMAGSRQSDAAEKAGWDFSHFVTAFEDISIRFYNDDPIPAGDRIAPTPKQREYLCFIRDYTRLNGEPPAQIDLRAYFKVSPPTIHQMILNLEKKGFLIREPGKARSLKVHPDYLHLQTH